MSFSFPKLNFSNPLQKAWGLWGLLIFTAIMSSVASHFHRSVIYAYRSGALNWLHGFPLYDATGKGFIYFPQAAILYIPFALLSPPLNMIVWCFVSVGFFAGGILKLLEFLPEKQRASFFLVMTAVAAPIAFSDARNGQMNLIMLALLCFTANSLGKFRWNEATFLMVLAVALKPLSLILIFPFLLIYPSLIGRFIIGMGALWGIPFFLQSPHYVWQQYMAMFQMLETASQVGTLDATHWAQLFNVLAQCHWFLSPTAQSVWRWGALGLLCGVSYYCRKNRGPLEAPFWILLLAVNYLLLFNPRTENNTYAILAPFIGYFMAHSFFIENNKKKTLFYLVQALGILFAFNLSGWIIKGQTSWVTPFMGILFTLSALLHLFRPSNSYREVEPSRHFG